MEDVVAANASETLEVLVRLAFEFGPFLFAILFMMVITRMAQKFYERVRTRTTPQPSPEERTAYRTFFVSSFVFGMLLVALSVGWWFYSHLSDEHNYEIVIVDLPHGGHLSSIQYDRVYRQEIRNENNRRDGTVEYRLLIVSDEPYAPGEPIALRISYPREPSDTAQVPLAGGIGPMPAEGGRASPTTAEFTQYQEVSVPHNGTPKCRYTLNRLLRENGLMDVASSRPQDMASGMPAMLAGSDTGTRLRPASQATVMPIAADGLPPSMLFASAAPGPGNPAASLPDGLIPESRRPESLAPAQQSLSNFCVTPTGSCVLPDYGPVGAPCWCNTPSGPVEGTLH